MPHLLPRTGPQRVIAASNLAYTIGSGVQLTAGVLYFTQAVRLPAAQVGLGLGIAGAVSLVVGVAVGRVADVRGARGVYAMTLVVRASATAAFTLVHGFWPFLAAVSVATAAQAAGLAARGPLIRRYGGERPQEFRAYLRSITNVGVSMGALLAGWAVQVGTLAAYRLLVLGGAASIAAAAAVLPLLPSVGPLPAPAGPRWVALRDAPYLLLTALDGIMAVQFKILTIAVPLWLVQDTSAPRGLVSVTMLVNTVLVVACQVRAGRSVDTPSAGAAAYRRAGVAFLGSCALVPLSAGASAWPATAVLLTAVTVHTVGELWHSAAGFELSYALAPEHATGQYLGVFGLGAGLADAVGPGLLIGLCIDWGRPGWYAVGALLVATGLAAPATVRRVERRRSIGSPAGGWTTGARAATGRPARAGAAGD
ncbi:MFS transporter [Kitasatospora sp. RB6PN24]|uniref:MFS transporter n=1 Tax=Kitasatospora humi TaxID=2893891 RepID=UPI001E4FF616|nr:MFS transporter [Kitasatospora humi]MCC9307930.1 MFS transporter [Kitasatospora humi]